MKLLHISDLHLDSPFKGILSQDERLSQQFNEASKEACRRGIQLAIDESVDLVLISGDVYNSERQSVAARHFFHQQMVRLDQKDIPVVLIHGNHDYIKARDYFVNYPQNVHVLDSDEVSYVDLITKDSETVRVYGFSYRSRWIDQSQVDQFPQNPNETLYTIGMMHGAIEGSEREANHYAPFKRQDLIDRRYDYWALGHIHKPQVLSEYPLIQYAGTTLGRHRHELGSHGAYLVTFKNRQLIENRFVSLAPIEWRRHQIEAQDEWDLATLMQQLNQIQNNYHQDAEARNTTFILDIMLDHAERLDDELYNDIQEGNVVQSLNKPNYENVFALINQINCVHHDIQNVFQYDESLNASYQKVTSLANEAPYEPYFKQLRNHRVVRQYMDQLVDESFKKEVYQRAMDLIVQRTGLNQEEEDHDEN